MKLCLFGGSGLLGSEFKRIFAERSLDFVAPESHKISLLDHAAVLDFITQEKPDLIINCAAYTAVDKAETDKKACFALNTEAVENLIKADIPIINFSTEYVFNAPAGTEIPEDYARDPQGVYAQSKAQMEEVLEAFNTDWWNIRTSWLFGPEGNNFVSTILRLSQKYDELKIIDDQIGRPTYAPDLAEFVTEQFIVKSQPTGHYHLQNSGEVISWAGFAAYFLELNNWQGTIKKISTKEYAAPAPRPKNSALKNTKLKTGLRDWEGAIKKYLSL